MHSRFRRQPDTPKRWLHVLRSEEEEEPSGPDGIPSPAEIWERKDGTGLVAAGTKGVADYTAVNVYSAAWGSDYFDGGFGTSPPTGSEQYTPNGSFGEMGNWSWYKWLWFLAAPVASSSVGCIGNGTAYSAGNYSCVMHIASSKYIWLYISNGTGVTPVTSAYDFSANTGKWVFCGFSYGRTGGASDNIVRSYFNDGTTEEFNEITNGNLMVQNSSYEMRLAPLVDRSMGLRQGTELIIPDFTSDEADFQEYYTNWGRTGGSW